MPKIIYIHKEINQIAKKIIENTNTKILVFKGPMGAGKTTLIKSLVKNLGGAEEANSPTFGIVNEYVSQKGELLAYHFDFYRLNDEMEALDMGLEDYLNSDVWVFMEWPEKIPNLLPANTTFLQLEIIDAQTRRISF
ncbi:tRNA (adenosine(37)-N6)-threonylcarbamoyltransferase complex ATPase subunit type 1 TsaE [Maribacter sp. 2304DJ31-5]|uniref:tRNA (adenosine(37)-N6)-threonylcarbamoyltransferase complex ATPase subunit type 1 TsaE n=1 Tax=Maribacter sp. 2304DJ31-5 TaxID=3386273 RepID=UPI0039BCD93C